MPSPLSVPADRVAPCGTPLIVTLRTSELSVRPASISSAIALSSDPLASDTSNVGASAIPATSTVISSTTTALSVPSVVETDTVRSKLPLKFSPGVIVKPSRSATSRVQVPSPLSVPADRVAPSGTPEMVIEMPSFASSSSVSIERAIALSSAPAASPTSSVAPSATASTSTVKLVLVDDVLPLASVLVAVTERSKLPL